MRIAILTMVVAASALGTARGQGPRESPEPRRPLWAPPTTTQVQQRVERLERGADKAVRLGAIRWLKEHAYVSDAALAVPALERCVRLEKTGDGQGRGEDPELRSEAVIALALIAHQRRQPCPLLLVEALLDKEEDVREQAINCIGLFQSFPRGSVELLLRSVESERVEVRDASVWALAGAGGKEKRALAAIEKAKGDREFQVRHNAHVAAYRVTGDLEGLLRYGIRLAEDPDALLNPLPQDRQARERDRTIVNLALIHHLSPNEWSEDRAEELAPVLMRLLEDKTPLMRRGAARKIGAAAVAPSPKKPEKAPQPQPSKLALALEKLKAGDRLRRLMEDDPDERVRGAAALAVDRLESVLGKKP